MAMTKLMVFWAIATLVDGSMSHDTASLFQVLRGSSCEVWFGQEYEQFADEFWRAICEILLPEAVLGQPAAIKCKHGSKGQNDYICDKQSLSQKVVDESVLNQDDSISKGKTEAYNDVLKWDPLKKKGEDPNEELPIPKLKGEDPNEELLIPKLKDKDKRIKELSQELNTLAQEEASLEGEIEKVDQELRKLDRGEESLGEESLEGHEHTPDEWVDYFDPNVKYDPDGYSPFSHEIIAQVKSTKRTEESQAKLIGRMEEEKKEIASKITVLKGTIDSKKKVREIKAREKEQRAGAEHKYDENNLAYQFMRDSLEMPK